MKKLISFLLSFVFLINYLSFYVVKATDVNQSEKYSIKVLSSEIGLKEINLIKVNDEYLMDLNDITKMTRTTRVDDGNIIELNQGIRKIIINKEKQTLKEVTIHETRNIIIKSIDNIDYAPAYSLLTYLGATCSIEEGIINITMPLYTLWETINFNFSNYTLDAHSLWGNDIKIIVGLINDTLMQAIFGVGFLDFTGKLMEGILYEILDVNMFDYNGCIEENQKVELKIEQNSNFMLKSAYNILYGEFGDTKDKFLDTMSLIEKYIGLYSEELKEKIPHKFSESNSELISNFFEKIKWGADVCSDILDDISRIYTCLNYTDETIKTMDYFTKEIEPDKIYYSKANSINQKLFSEKDIILNTALERVEKFVLDFLVDKGKDSLKKLLSLSTKEFLFALDVGKFVTSLMPDSADYINATDAELKAMILVGMQADVLEMIISKENLIESGDKSVKLLESYKYLVSYWVRTTMLANEKLITVAKSNNGDKTLIEPLEKCNSELSAILFKLSMCQVKEIVWLEDNLFKNLPLIPISREIKISGGHFTHFMFYNDEFYTSIGNTHFKDISDMLNGKVKEFYIKDDKIYYFKELDYGVLGLFSCNLDGTETVQLAENVMAFGTRVRVLINDTIYYENSQKSVGNFCKYNVVNKSLEELKEDEIFPAIFDDTYIYYNSSDGVYRCLLDYSQKEKISDKVQTIIGVDKYFLYTINEENKLQKSNKNKYSEFEFIDIPEKTTDKMFQSSYAVYADSLYMYVNNKVYKLINDKFETLIELENNSYITDFVVAGNKSIIYTSKYCDDVYQYCIYEFDITDNTIQLLSEEIGPDPYAW